jgi:NADH:ubiquinone oxidoreductase subunit 3 (subunit A)
VIGSIVFYVIVNAIFFSFIFWILTFILKFYYSNKISTYKLNFYECGFKSLHNIKIQYNINFILLILFLLIYDGEFLILIPISLNMGILTFNSIYLLFLFIVLLIITLLFDLIYSALEWQV